MAKALMSVLLAIHCVCGAYAGENHEADLARDLRDTLVKYREYVDENLLKDLTQEERAVFSQIRFEVPANLKSFPLPHAVKVGRERKIVFSVGYHRVVWSTILAMQIGREIRKESDFFGDYLKHVVDRFRNYSRLSEKDREALGVDWPTVYAEMKEPERIAFETRKDIVEEQAAALMGSFAFIYLHEVAHHVLGHLDAPVVGTAQERLDESRKREQAADDWAIKRMLDNTWMPVGGFFGLILYYFFDEGAVLHEKDRTHPPEHYRFRNIFTKTSAHLDRFRERAELQGINIEELKSSMKKIVDSIETEIKSVREQLK